MELVHSNMAINSSTKLKAKVITVTSGKGGVGKTSTATNLALSLSALNKKVCVFDADASLANINILLGIHPEYTLHHLLTGEKKLKQIMVDGPRGLKVIPGATGISDYAQLSVEQKSILIDALDELQQQFDYLIIDTAAGIGDDVLDFVKASQFSIVIITPEPTSLTDAFSLLKVLKRADFDRTSYILVNMAMDYENSQTIYRRFESAVKKYIKVDIAYLGFIQVDETVISSVSLQCPAVLLSPDCIASRCFKTLAKGLVEQIDDSESESFSSFWKNQKPETLTSQQTNRPNSSNKNVAINTENSNTVEAAPPALDFTSSANFCTEQLAQGNLDSDHVRSLLEPLISNYKNAYPSQVEESTDDVDNTMPIRDFYTYIEQNDFPKDELKDTINTLESVYLERYGKNSMGFEHNVVQLFSQYSGKESDLLHLNQQLQNSYLRHFNKPLYNVFEEFKKQITDESYPINEFEKLLDTTLSDYQQKFSKKYKTQADIDLDKALTALEKAQNENSSLKEQLQSSEKSQKQQDAVIKQIELLLSGKKTTD